MKAMTIVKLAPEDETKKRKEEVEKEVPDLMTPKVSTLKEEESTKVDVTKRKMMVMIAMGHIMMTINVEEEERKVEGEEGTILILVMKVISVMEKVVKIDEEDIAGETEVEAMTMIIVPMAEEEKEDVEIEEVDAEEMMMITLTEADQVIAVVTGDVEDEKTDTDVIETVAVMEAMDQMIPIDHVTAHVVDEIDAEAMMKIQETRVMILEVMMEEEGEDVEKIKKEEEEVAVIRLTAMITVVLSQRETEKVGDVEIDADVIDAETTTTLTQTNILTHCLMTAVEEGDEEKKISIEDGVEDTPQITMMTTVTKVIEVEVDDVSGIAAVLRATFKNVACVRMKTPPTVPSCVFSKMITSTTV